MRKFWFALLFPFLIFVPACIHLSAEGLQEVSAEPVELNVSALKGPTGIGMIRLFEHPPDFEDEVNLSLSVANSPDIMIARIINGETDIASLPTNVAARLYTKGVGYILGGITGYGLLYIVSSDPTVTSLSSLKGKIVHSVGKGSTPEYILKFLLEKKGLNPGKDVLIDFTMDQVELSKSIIAGRVATALLPEPFVTRVLSANLSAALKVDMQQEWREVFADGGTYPMSCVVVNRQFWENSPGVVAEFLEEYSRSIEWVNENPVEAGRLTEKHGFGIPETVAAEAIPRLNLGFLDGPAARKEMEEYLQVLYNYAPESIGGSLPDEDFYGKE